MLLRSRPGQRLYDDLGVPRGASPVAIKKAYRKLALEHHPDKSTASDAVAQFVRVDRAYKVLSNADARAEYDEDGSNITAEKFEALVKTLSSASSCDELVHV